MAEQTNLLEMEAWESVSIENRCYASWNGINFVLERGVGEKMRFHLEKRKMKDVVFHYDQDEPRKRVLFKMYFL